MGVKLNMSRRTFVKAAAITGAAAAAFAGNTGSALAEKTYPEISGQDTVEVKSCCRGCGKMECGVKVIVQNGRAIRIEADEGAWQSMGNCCSKSQSSVQAAYHPDRLHYPMKRTNPKGEDPGWVRISWDDAIKETCDGLMAVKKKYGGEAIACQVGTSRIWCMHSESILKNLLETCNNIEAWQICKGPRHFATTMVSQFAMSWMETITRPKVFVQWAGASELSNYDDSCRTTVDVASRADVHISVDPRMANLGKEADYWQNLRPGTDGALALAWTNVIIEKKLYDDLYVKKWTNAPFLVCMDMEPSGFPSVRTDGSYWDVKTHLLKESDIKEGGSPFKFLVYDNNWKKLKEKGITHEYGAFTWFNADQEGRIDETGGFWEGENYNSVTARETGKEAAQDNLLPGQTQGWVPDLLPFDPEIDPALEGEFEITLKDGKKVKVKPVWEYYKAAAAEYPLDRAEEITGIPADQIEEAATVYGTRIDPSTGYGNGGIQYMLAQEHACNAIQNSRALDNLVGITGNMDTPGGNRGPTIVPIDGDLQGFSAWAPGASTPPAELMEKQIGVEKFPLLHWWQYWSDGPTCYDAMVTGEPYPLRALWNESGNFMAFANTTRAWEGLCNLDFYVDLNLWHAPSTDAADIILPVAHWIELNSPRASQGSAGAMGATVKCVEPPAEAKYDPEIVMAVAKQLGVPWNDEKGNEWPDIEWQLDDSIKLFTDDELTWTEWTVKDGKVSKKRHGVEMSKVKAKYTWNEYVAEFQKNGWWQAKDVEPRNWGTYRRYQTGALRARDRVWARLDYTSGKGIGDWKPGWFTPTMKQEIWSTVMETTYPDTQEWWLPSWKEPPHGPKDGDRIKEYPLTATTGRRIPCYFHSEHRQLPWCREMWPVPRIEINPVTAAKYGIEQGDWVWIETEWGKIREVADLYYGVDESVVNLEHTWWYPEVQDAGHGFQLSAVNQLLDHHAQDPHSGSSNLRAYQVKIYKATAENSPFNNPVPCDSSGTPIIHTSDDPRLKEWLPTYEGRDQELSSEKGE